MTRPHVALAALLALAPAGAALAQDRAPTAEETTRIEEALRAAGYTSWQMVKFDHGVWEVEDAAAADGLFYDLSLDASYAITRRDHEGDDSPGDDSE